MATPPEALEACDASQVVAAPEDDVRNVIIIGSGPAGLTAAIYTARAGLRPLIVEGEVSSTSDQPGGQLMLTTEVENFPGFVDGVLGPELMSSMRQQAARFGAEYLTTKVTKVDLGGRPFRLWADSPDGGTVELRARSVIVATGARSLLLGLDNEVELIGHGVSTCATCDGFFFRGQHIAVVGGGDSAIEEATFLTRFAETVTIVHRRDELRASKIMQDRAFSNPKIRFVWNSVVTDLLDDDGKVRAVTLRDVQTGAESELAVTGLFVAIGHAPNTDVFRGWLDMDDAGYLQVTKGTATNIDGIFAAGDVSDHEYRQAVTAAGSGCMAALDAERWLEAQEDAHRDAVAAS